MSGAQGASRPRKGPSPPGWRASLEGSRTSFRPTRADLGHSRRLVMPARDLPVRPDLDQLKHEAKDLLRALHAADPAAVAELREFHPDVDPRRARLADAQLVLARSYGASSWPRLVLSCDLIDA